MRGRAQFGIVKSDPETKNGDERDRKFADNTLVLWDRAVFGQIGGERAVVPKKDRIPLLLRPERRTARSATRQRWSVIRQVAPLREHRICCLGERHVGKAWSTRMVAARADKEQPLPSRRGVGRQVLPVVVANLPWCNVDTLEFTDVFAEVVRNVFMAGHKRKLPPVSRAREDRAAHVVMVSE